MSLCILAAGKTTVLAVASFTLAWTHSVERTRWIETWTVTETGSGSPASSPIARSNGRAA